MECKLTVSVVEESVEGDIGDDWEYSVTATVIDAKGRSIESGRIRVPEHLLKPGAAQPPPQAAGVKVRAGACGTFAKVELRVDVNEVDWLVDDPGWHPGSMGLYQRSHPRQRRGHRGGQLWIIG